MSDTDTFPYVDSAKSGNSVFIIVLTVIAGLMCGYGIIKLILERSRGDLKARVPDLVALTNLIIISLFIFASVGVTTNINQHVLDTALLMHILTIMFIQVLRTTRFIFLIELAGSRSYGRYNWAQQNANTDRDLESMLEDEGDEDSESYEDSIPYELRAGTGVLGGGIAGGGTGTGTGVPGGVPGLSGPRVPGALPLHRADTYQESDEDGYGDDDDEDYDYDDVDYSASYEDYLDRDVELFDEHDDPEPNSTQRNELYRQHAQNSIDCWKLEISQSSQHGAPSKKGLNSKDLAQALLDKNGISPDDIHKDNKDGLNMDKDGSFDIGRWFVEHKSLTTSIFMLTFSLFIFIQFGTLIALFAFSIGSSYAYILWFIAIALNVVMSGSIIAILKYIKVRQYHLYETSLQSWHEIDARIKARQELAKQNAAAAAAAASAAAGANASSSDLAGNDDDEYDPDYDEDDEYDNQPINPEAYDPHVLLTTEEEVLPPQPVAPAQSIFTATGDGGLVMLEMLFTGLGCFIVYIAILLTCIGYYSSHNVTVDYPFFIITPTRYAPAWTHRAFIVVLVMKLIIAYTSTVNPFFYPIVHDLFFSNQTDRDAEGQQASAEYNNLTFVLLDTVAREKFRVFLDGEFSAENLLFYNAITEYKAKLETIYGMQAASTVSSAKYIYSTYLSTSGVYEVNISSNLRQRIQKELNLLTEQDFLATVKAKEKSEIMSALQQYYSKGDLYLYALSDDGTMNNINVKTSVYEQEKVKTRTVRGIARLVPVPNDYKHDPSIVEQFAQKQINELYDNIHNIITHTRSGNGAGIHSTISRQTQRHSIVGSMGSTGGAAVPVGAATDKNRRPYPPPHRPPFFDLIEEAKIGGGISSDDDDDDEFLSDDDRDYPMPQITDQHTHINGFAINAQLTTYTLPQQQQPVQRQQPAPQQRIVYTEPVRTVSRVTQRRHTNNTNTNNNSGSFVHFNGDNMSRHAYNMQFVESIEELPSIYIDNDDNTINNTDTPSQQRQQQQQNDDSQIHSLSTALASVLSETEMDEYSTHGGDSLNYQPSQSYMMPIAPLASPPGGFDDGLGQGTGTRLAGGVPAPLGGSQVGGRALPPPIQANNNNASTAPVATVPAEPRGKRAGNNLNRAKNEGEPNTLNKFTLMSLEWKIMALQRRLAIHNEWNQKMIVLFDAAHTEVFSLMERDSFARFTKTTEWKDYMNAISQLPPEEQPRYGNIQ